MKRRVNIGNELEGEIILVEQKNKLIDTQVRAVITITVMLLEHCKTWTSRPALEPEQLALLRKLRAVPLPRAE